jgi:hypothetical protein
MKTDLMGFNIWDKCKRAFKNLLNSDECPICKHETEIKERYRKEVENERARSIGNISKRRS